MKDLLLLLGTRIHELRTSHLVDDEHLGCEIRKGLRLPLRLAQTGSKMGASPGSIILCIPAATALIKELRRRELTNKVYLWSDDNLSNDYFWRYLTDDQRASIRGYRNYCRLPALCLTGTGLSMKRAFKTQALDNVLVIQISGGATGQR